MEATYEIRKDDSVEITDETITLCINAARTLQDVVKEIFGSEK